MNVTNRLYKKEIRECSECPNCSGLPTYPPKCNGCNSGVLRLIETYPDIPGWCPLPGVYRGNQKKECNNWYDLYDFCSKPD